MPESSYQRPSADATTSGEQSDLRNDDQVKKVDEPDACPQGPFEGFQDVKVVSKTPTGPRGVISTKCFEIGDTICTIGEEEALDRVTVDEPTLHMTFRINDSPFCGREGKYLTSRQIRERLQRECAGRMVR